MGILLDWLIAIVSLILLLPITMLFAEIVLGFGKVPVMTKSGEPRGPTAILIPAHNEERTISATIRSLKSQLGPLDRLIVIADNCSDGTATIAVAEGAEAISRSDEKRRGKGFALDFGIRHLESRAPDSVIVIDADCIASEQLVEVLTDACETTGRPIQSLYVMRGGADAGPLTRIAEFAWAIKNLARPLGLRRAGLPCQLMGTGMAFPWSLIKSANLATESIVEDLRLGIELSAAGAGPLFFPSVTVASTFPATAEGMREQRVRWEHGNLGVIVSMIPGLLRTALKRRGTRLFLLALDVSIPPLALLSILLATLWCVGLLLFVTLGAGIALTTASLSLFVFSLTIMLAWVQYGRNIVSVVDLLLAVAYAIWKVPVYVRYFVAREDRWIRARRDRDS